MNHYEHAENLGLKMIDVLTKAKKPAKDFILIIARNYQKQKKFEESIKFCEKLYQ
jgi:hypothetical protein